MIQMVSIQWEEFNRAFSHVFWDVDRFLGDSTADTLSVRRPDWCLRIDHDRGFIIFDYQGSFRPEGISLPKKPYLFKIEGCPYLI
nr:hypothetical protein [uncultured Dethiosulfovibrio sp.]